MNEHKFVINRVTGVVFGRTTELDAHPNCTPYWPEEGAAAATPSPMHAEEPPAAPAATPSPVAPRPKKSERKNAAVAATAADAAVAAADAALEQADLDLE